MRTETEDRVLPALWLTQSFDSSSQWLDNEADQTHGEQSTADNVADTEAAAEDQVLPTPGLTPSDDSPRQRPDSEANQTQDEQSPADDAAEAEVATCRRRVLGLHEP